MPITSSSHASNILTALQVAQETAGKFNPNVKIEAHHANIKDPHFNVAWFQSFAIVFNALDNLDARRHVNKMCLAADVPLIESGTTGFNGQVQPIRKGLTECYDCTPKETPKSYPVCTIRSTPSQLIHCIVWAKSYAFAELFGTSEDDAPDLDHTEDSGNTDEIENLRKEAAALKKIRMAMGSEEFPRRVFEKLYTEDIERLISMEDMWKTRKAPTALQFDELLPEVAKVDTNIASQDQRSWTLAENVAVFSGSLKRLSDRLEEHKASADAGSAPPVLSFDKDDKDTLDFVASAANLRSIIFGIETRSEFDIKQMAGNIIPAIATTNATTAALCVLEAFKIMQGNLQKSKMVFLAKSADRMINQESLRPPQPDCAICGNAQATLKADTSKATLDELVEQLLKVKLGYKGELSISTDVGIVYDPDMEDNLSKTLQELGIEKDTFITIRDEEDEDTKVNLVLSIHDSQETGEHIFTLVPDQLVIPVKAKPANGVAATNGDATTTNGDSGEAHLSNGKRKRSADEAQLESDQISKRGKVAEESNGTEKNGDAPIVVVDDDGAILLD